MSKPFFEITIGSTETYNRELTEYNYTKQFIAAQGHIYGINSETKPDSLSSFERETIAEAYGSNPEWSSKGPLRFTEPESIVAGRIIFELFEKECPKTCSNFLALCTGSKGMSKMDKKKPLHYKNCSIHRIVKDFVAQGGDILRGDGSGGDSIFNGKFNDEKPGLKLKFQDFGMNGKYVLAMANSGKNSNTSQFFVSMTDDLKKLETLNGKHVIFGQVVQGFEVVDKLNRIGAEDGRPLENATISDCGA